MKTARSLMITAALAVSAFAHAWADDGSGDVAKAITALEKQWAEGEASNKIDPIAPLFADKFIITESNGKVAGKAAFLAEEKANHYASSEVDDVKVLVYGDTAIANYALHQKYTSKGKSFDDHSRQTDTWIKSSSGKWQVVASHGSKIATS